MSLDAIQSAIPHRPPFLLVDEIVSQDEQQIVCRKTFAQDEWFYAGHYPSFPITPGVLLCEAAMQAGAILLSQYVQEATDPTSSGKVPVATRMNEVRFKHMVRPGETIEIAVTLVERVSSAFFLKATVKNISQPKCPVAVRLEFACTMAPAGN